MDIPVFSLFGLIFQWDITVILILAVMGMTAMTVWLWQKQFRFTPLIGIWLLFLLILSIGLWQVYNQESGEIVKNTLSDTEWNQMMQKIRWGALLSLILLLALYMSAVFELQAAFNIRNLYFYTVACRAVAG